NQHVRTLKKTVAHGARCQPQKLGNAPRLGFSVSGALAHQAKGATANWVRRNMGGTHGWPALAQEALSGRGCGDRARRWPWVLAAIFATTGRNGSDPQGTAKLPRNIKHLRPSL